MSEAMTLTERLDSACATPDNWDTSGLLSDAAVRIRELENEMKSACDAVSEIAIIIRETASPISIIATDILERLRKVHERLSVVETVEA